MRRIKSAKIHFCFAVMLLVAKPFLGFTMFSRIHPPAPQNIFVKAFTKRTLEYSEDTRFNMSSIQKKLATPVFQLLLRLSLLLSILFPFVIDTCSGINNSFLRGIQLGLSPRRQTWLLNSSLII